MGIEQLVDAYKGSPAPLDEKVKKAQQGQAPGSIPPDLEEAIALQKINELRNSAKGQQAIQAGGAQPSVVEKLRQMLSAQQRQQGQPLEMPQGMAQGMPQMAQGPQGQPPVQGQPPMQPVMAARGGSIDQLMSNLGRHYAGGGIVAFTPGGDVEDKEKLTEEEAREIMRRIRQRTDMRPESMAITEGDFSSIPGFVAGNRFQQEMDRASGRQEPMTPQQMEAKVRPAPREEAQREPYSGPQQYTLQQQGADYVARKEAARIAKAKEEAENEARRQALISQIPTGGPETPASTGRMPSELERNLSNTFAAMPGASVRKAFSGSGIRGLMGLLGVADDREERPSKKPSPTDLDFRRQPDPRTMGIPAVAPDTTQRKEITGTSPDDIRPAPPRVTTGRADSAPMPGGLADLAKIPSVGVGTEYQRRMLAENQQFDPEAYKAKFLKEVGPRDLSIYDEMAAELKARKERLKNPEPGFDSLMEYLGQIAQSGGGRSWMESGAKGAAGVKALQKERQAQQDTLVDKILDLGSKKKEAEYNERLGLFNLTKTEKDRIDNQSREIAGKLSLSEDKEIELRQQMTIEMMKIKANKEIQSMPGAEQRFFNQMANTWLAQPENKGKTMFDAYTAFRLAGAPSAAGKGVMTRDQASDNVMKKIAYDSPIRSQLMEEAANALKKTGIASPTATQITDYLIDKELGKANSPAASSSGKVVDFNSLPK